jgi:hypothetical protein
MKLVDFYERVLETTGLDVMTLGSLKAAIKNCMADLTSRGYRVFKEKTLSELTSTATSYQDHIMIEVDAPKDIRKILYCKVFFNNYAVVAKRYSLSNPRVACQFIKGKFRSSLQSNEAIFFIKGDKLIIEWHPALGNITDVAFGYYEKITTPEFDTNVSDVQNLRDVEIDIRPEFEDALVFYAAYFYYSRYVKDTDKIQLYLSNYKYYVEDISHELSYEDEYFEEDAVIRTEDLD